MKEERRHHAEALKVQALQGVRSLANKSSFEEQVTRTRSKPLLTTEQVAISQSLEHSNTLVNASNYMHTGFYSLTNILLIVHAAILYSLSNILLIVHAA